MDVSENREIPSWTPHQNRPVNLLMRSPPYSNTHRGQSTPGHKWISQLTCIIDLARTSFCDSAGNIEVQSAKAELVGYGKARNLRNPFSLSGSQEASLFPNLKVNTTNIQSLFKPWIPELGGAWFTGGFVNSFSLFWAALCYCRLGEWTPCSASWLVWKELFDTWFIFALIYGQEHQHHMSKNEWMSWRVQLPLPGSQNLFKF